MSGLHAQQYETLASAIYGGMTPQGSCLVWYGSGVEGHDVDLVLVQESPVPFPRAIVGQLDVSLFSVGEFLQLTNLLDPAATEPLLTGHLIGGDDSIWHRLVGAVGSIVAATDSVVHLQSRSLKNALIVGDILARAKDTDEQDHLRWALINLSFSISYASFAKYYRRLPYGAVTMKRLREEAALLLPEFWPFLDRVKRRQDQLLYRDARGWLDRWIGTPASGPHGVA